MSTFNLVLEQAKGYKQRMSAYLFLLPLLYLVAAFLIYPFLLSPVKHIPGPWYCRISRLPLKYSTYKRRRTPFVTSILDRYGPTVVIAPDQVHTTNSEAMNIIYDKTSVKTPFYASMGSWKGVTSTLGFLTYPEASPSRNNLVQCFQNRNLTTLVDNIESHVDDFIALLDMRSEAGDPVDGVVVFRLLALDIVTDILWGEPNRLLSNVNEDAARRFIRRFHAFSTWNAMKSFIPGADTFVRLFGNARWRTLRSDCNDLDITAREALERWESHPESRNDKDVLSMLQSMNSAKACAVPSSNIPAYMVEMLAAGSSTTSHPAAFASFLLARHPAAQARLREELCSVFPDPSNIDIRTTTDLTFLDGVVRETMRMYPMIPGPLERYLSKDLDIGGLPIPRGVIASNAAYNQGRLPDVYPEPDQWQPQRWIDADERMKLNWIPFGHGARSCPGSNLAMTELKYMLGKIFRLFEATIPEGREDETLEMADVFAAGSRSGDCWLKFIRATDK